MTPTDPEWLAAELLTDPRETFVLWLIRRGLCTDLDSFRRHYGPDFPAESEVEALISRGFLAREGGAFRLTELGRETIALVTDGLAAEPAHRESRKEAVTKAGTAGTTWGVSSVAMLDYVLGQAEGRERADLDAALAEDPALAERLERLGWSLGLLLDDGEDTYAPPRDLARQTLDFVTRAARERPAVLEMTPARWRFRLGDFAVAATIFLAGILALTPAILRSKLRYEIASADPDAAFLRLDRCQARSEKLAAKDERVKEILVDVGRTRKALEALKGIGKSQWSKSDFDEYKTLLSSIDRIEARLAAIEAPRA